MPHGGVALLPRRDGYRRGRDRNGGRKTGPLARKFADACQVASTQRPECDLVTRTPSDAGGFFTGFLRAHYRPRVVEQRTIPSLPKKSKRCMLIPPTAMKFFAIVAVAFVPITALADGVPVNPFPDAKIGIPPLSLGEAAKQGTPPVLANPPVSFRSAAPAAPQKRVSRMPIIPPRPEIDAKLRILTPDESVDYKLIVKEPDVEPAK
jgi:hypothetical protein